MKKVYLCGPIMGKSDSECVAWRAELIKWGAVDQIECLDPMRRDYRGVQVDHVDEIINEDLKDIIDCDAVLVSAEVPSWGTAMELVYAKTLGKPVFAFFGSTTFLSVWLIHHTTSLHSSMQEAWEAMLKELR